VQMLWGPDAIKSADSRADSPLAIGEWRNVLEVRPSPLQVLLFLDTLNVPSSAEGPSN